jgi:hypothetical protein
MFFEKNRNIYMKKDREMLKIYFQTYDISWNLRTHKKWIEKIKRKENFLKKKYDCSDIIIKLAAGYKIDGHSKTNTFLINNGSMIKEVLTKKYLSIKY